MGGDQYQPQTLLQSYSYVLNNPVNAVDPSGRYHLDVHYGETRNWVSEIATAYAVSTVCGRDISDLIAEANKRVDTHHTKLSSLVACRRCHFCPWAATVRHIDAAIASGNPYLFGSALHQVQDYFSHWAEGYGEGGHAGDSARAGVKPEQTSQRSQVQIDDFFQGGHYETSYGYTYWVESPYPAHPKEKVRSFLKRTNPNANIDNLDEDGLIDLYLRRDQGRDQSLRAYFGIDPDRYIPGSSRDDLMKWFARHYISKFFEQVVADTCVIDCENDVDAIRQLLVE